MKNKEIKIEYLLDLEDCVHAAEHNLLQALTSVKDALHFTNKNFVPRKHKKTIKFVQKQIKALSAKLGKLSEEITNHELFDNE